MLKNLIIHQTIRNCLFCKICNVERFGLAKILSNLFWTNGIDRNWNWN